MHIPLHTLQDIRFKKLWQPNVYCSLTQALGTREMLLLIARLNKAGREALDQAIFWKIVIATEGITLDPTIDLTKPGMHKRVVLEAFRLAPARVSSIKKLLPLMIPPGPPLQQYHHLKEFFTIEKTSYSQNVEAFALAGLEEIVALWLPLVSEEQLRSLLLVDCPKHIVVLVENELNRREAQALAVKDLQLKSAGKKPADKKTIRLKAKVEVKK